MAVPKPHSKKILFTPDEWQREAIEHTHGPMLVIAGAGTGKTSVLIHRIARMVHEGHAKPEQILALTYTVAAAGEMRDRVTDLLGQKIHATTFHDYCNGLLRRAGRDFGVLDEKDLWIYLRKRIHELHLQHYVKAANVSKFLFDLLDFLSRCHDELVTPEKYAEYVVRLERGESLLHRVAKSKEKLSDEEMLARCREISGVFATTERWLREENYGTFSHMITRAHELLTADQRVLAEERERARFIVVDEFQDANFAQIQILAALAGESANVFGVGDPDQGIYRFRGASSAAFQLFRQHFPQTKLVVLGKNRRSTTAILQCAYALVDKNPAVFPSNGAGPRAILYRRTPLQSARDEEAKLMGKNLFPPPVEAISFTGKLAEAPDVVRIVEETRRHSRCKWKDFAVLYRSHGHRDDVARELAEHDIPFSIENMDVGDTPEVRDLFACVSAVADVGDDASLFRVAALPKFKVDPEELRSALRQIAKDSRDGGSVPLHTVLGAVEGGAEVLACVRSAREQVRGNVKASEAFHLIANTFGFDASSPVLQAAFSFVRGWQEKAITKKGDLAEWIDYLGYFHEAGGAIPLGSQENEDAVRLMSAHGAKGLEFQHVFILRSTSGSFPCSYRETLVEFPAELRGPGSAIGVDDKTLHEQEERRLFYVAMTRAKDTLRIYGKQGIGKDKTPAGFMRELIGSATLRPWLRSREAYASQAELIELAAAADAAHPQGSRLPAWLALPALAGLDARLSATAVETYETCPLQFKFEREWKLSRQIHGAMQYGAAMHRVLRTYYDSCRLGRAKTDDELLRLFTDDLGASRIQDDYQLSLYLQQGLEQLKEFLAGVRSAPAIEVLHTEEWFDVEIGGSKLTGRIDRIDRAADGGVVVVDYKTGKARTQEDADDSLQLSIYAMAAQQKWGYRVSGLAFHNLEGNIPVISKRTDFDLEEARERVAAVARGISEGNFKPKPDYHCNFCAFRGLCPAKEKAAPKLASHSLNGVERLMN
jgi:DNA helicase-2/ATP-dependent DNA helicase PcrA